MDFAACAWTMALHMSLATATAFRSHRYGYIREFMPLTARTIRDYPCKPFKDGVYIDKDGYLNVDDFGTSINLMMQCGMRFRGGRLIEGDFETCLKVLRCDLDSGRLDCPKRRKNGTRAAQATTHAVTNKVSRFATLHPVDLIGANPPLPPAVPVVRGQLSC